jgi:uncharacterized protein (UPF0147 family)
MTTQELINSGMLELYVSGTLNEADSKLIATAAIQFSEVKDEINKIEKNLIAAFENEGNEISIEAKTKIFKAVNVLDSIPQKNTIPLHKKSNLLNWAAAAVLLLFISSVFVILNLSKEKSELQSQQNQTKIDVENLASRIAFLQQASDKAALDMQVFRSHDYKKVMMTEVEGRPHQAACVYWNPITHKLFVDNCGLVNAGEGKAYQLWAMKNGKPISVGLFNKDMFNKGLQEFASIDSVESFAVTIENAAGATIPSMDALQVAAKI